MFCFQHNRACALPSADPHSARTGHEGEWVVANQVCRPRELELNGVIRNRTNATELVGHTQHDSGAVCAIGSQFEIVRPNLKFAVDSTSGEGPGDNLVAFEIAIDPQITPVADGFFIERNGEGSVAEMRELLAVRVGFGELLEAFAAVEEELDVIAVRADEGHGEAGVFVVARPVECGLEDDLLFGVALRFVEAGGGLGLAEDVGDAVITDAIAAAEVGVRVVVEGAPADASGELWIGGDLVMNASVADGVLALTVGVVGGARGKGVADELGVEVEGSDGRRAVGSRSRCWCKTSSRSSELRLERMPPVWRVLSRECARALVRV